MIDNKDESLKETGRCAAAAIVEMVAALECDYDRLTELRDLESEVKEHLEAGCPPSHYDMTADDKAELAALKESAGECASREDTETRIHEDALSVEVRSDWHSPGDPDGAHMPSEFCILLATGGPAVRIRGELDSHCEPRRAWLEVQDWGTPWTQYFDVSQDVLLAYAHCFVYGEG